MCVGLSHFPKSRLGRINQRHASEPCVLISAIFVTYCREPNSTTILKISQSTSFWYSTTLDFVPTDQNQVQISKKKLLCLVRTDCGNGGGTVLRCGGDAISWWNERCVSTIALWRSSQYEKWEECVRKCGKINRTLEVKLSHPYIGVCENNRLRIMWHLIRRPLRPRVRRGMNVGVLQ